MKLNQYNIDITFSEKINGETGYGFHAHQGASPQLALISALASLTPDRAEKVSKIKIVPTR